MDMRNHRFIDLQAYIDANPNAITVIDTGDWHCVYQNQAGNQLYGDISGRKCWEAVVHSDEQCVFCKAKKAIDSGQTTSAEVPMPNGDWLLVQWTPIQQDRLDRPIEVVETISDITDYKQREKALEDALEQVRAMSESDPLTGMLNRNGLFKRVVPLASVMTRTAAPEKSQCSVVVIDVDHFKHLNDEYGHDVGDQALRLLAEVLAKQVRNNIDLCCRWGGEEFVLALFELDRRRGTEVVRRIRHTLAEQSIKKLGEKLTFSAGICSWKPTTTDEARLIEDLEGKIAQADELMYIAKRSGRDRIAVQGLNEFVA